MTVKELRKSLENIPDNTDVMIKRTDAGFQYNLLNSVTLERIIFWDGKLKATDKCLILSDV